MDDGRCLFDSIQQLLLYIFGRKTELVSQKNTQKCY